MIKDTINEGIIIGFLYRFPDLISEYMELIIPKFDFTDDSIIFLYNTIINAYIENGRLDDISINLYVSKFNKDDMNKWIKLKGLETIKKLAKFSESVSTFETAYNKLKTYNVLRYLNTSGFDVENRLDFIKDKNVEFIIKMYENKLVKALNYVNNINDSVLLGTKILDTYNNLKITPDIGIEIPLPIIDSITRGWRLNTVYAHALHSGYGKSRLMVNILSHISIVKKIPVLFCINEQDRKEIELMVLTYIANYLYVKKYNCPYINETDIALGSLKGQKDEIMIEAAKFIEKNSNLFLYEMQAWDLETIKLILKRHKLKGINYAAIDTFKAMRNIQSANTMSDWMQFVYTAEQLKKIIGSVEKNGLNMGLWITLQMTDESLLTNIMNSTCLATGKQVKHHLDYLMLFRAIKNHEKNNIRLSTFRPNNPFNGEITSLDMNKTYYLGVVDKNRGGIDSQHIIYEVQKGYMIFKELGYAKYKS